MAKSKSKPTPVPVKVWTHPSGSSVDKSVDIHTPLACKVSKVTINKGLPKLKEAIIKETRQALQEDGHQDPRWDDDNFLTSVKLAIREPGGRSVNLETLTAAYFATNLLKDYTFPKNRTLDLAIVFTTKTPVRDFAATSTVTDPSIEPPPTAAGFFPPEPTRESELTRTDESALAIRIGLIQDKAKGVVTVKKSIGALVNLCKQLRPPYCNTQ
eukprot:SAG11_NODE_3211_length_2607_cov_1.677831_2_plen_213_part_00